MTLYKEESIKKQALFNVASEMLIAARTAPKGKGVDNLVSVIIDGEDKQRLAEKMLEIWGKTSVSIFQRDSANVVIADVVVIFGTKIRSLGLSKCGMCGFSGCDEKNKYPKVPCVLNTTDLGIALGSAVSVAMNHRVDNRIMYTIGQAAMELGLLGDAVSVAYGVPLSATSKNPFFDRG